MTWTPAPFTGGVIWQDKPSVATALSAANLDQEENAEAAYAVALSQSVVDYFESGSVPIVGSPAPGSGATGDLYFVRSDGTLRRFSPVRVPLSAWNINADGVITTATTTAGSGSVATPTGLVKTGQMIAIRGAASGGKTLVATIATLTPGSPNDTVTLGAFAGGPTTATFAVSGAQCYAATDDQPVIQAAINANVGAGVILEAPAGKKIGLSTTVDFNAKAATFATMALAFSFRGAGGGGYQTDFWPGATEFWNFNQDECFLSSAPNVFNLGLGGFTVRALQDPLGNDVAQVYLTNQYGGGEKDDITIVGTGNAFDTFTATATNGTTGLTAVSTFAPTTYTNVKVGDYIYATTAGIADGTTITAINPVAGTITLSGNYTGSNGTVTFYAITPNAGIGFWIDNPANGQQRMERLYVANFNSTPPSVSSATATVGEGIRFGAQTYSTTATANLAAGQTQITNISTFAAWKPGAVVTITSGGGTVTIPANTRILRVNRAAGTATLSAALTGSGSATGATLTFAASGGNSGNMTFDTLLTYGCTYGLHGQAGAQTNQCVFNTLKLLNGSKGIFLEAGHAGHTFNSAHCEGNKTGVHLKAANINKFNAPIVSRPALGAPGDGSVGVLLDNCFGNILEPVYFGGNFWDMGVSAVNGASGNRVFGGWSGFAAMTKKYNRNGLNVVVDSLAALHQMALATFTSVQSLTSAATSGSPLVLATAASIYCDGAPLMLEGYIPYTQAPPGAEIEPVFRVDGSTVAIMAAIEPQFQGTRVDSATATNGSPTVTDASIALADQGKLVTGTGIPTGTYIGTVTAATSFLLSSSNTSQANVNFTGTTGAVSITIGGGGNLFGGPVKVEYPYTPAEGSHTFVFGAISSGNQATASLGAGAGGSPGAIAPGFLRVTRTDI